MLSRFATAFRLRWQPWTATTDALRTDVRELTRAVKALRNEAAEHARARTEEARALSTQLADVAHTLTELSAREGQLRAIARADSEAERHASEFEQALNDPTIEAHIRAAVEGTPLQTTPMPHCVVDGLLPDAFYRALVRTIPPIELFAGRPVNKQQLPVPFPLAPRFSSRIWSYLSDTVVERMIMPAVVRLFHEPLHAWIRHSFPALEDTDVPMETVGGRLMLRTNGYRIRPHRDQKLGFITVLMYMARPADSEEWGTQLFSVDQDRDANTIGPYWIDDDAYCHLVKEVAYRQNRALIFLNNMGAHGAEIPANAQPAGLQRYAYQFRIGPQRRVMNQMIETLPVDRQQGWRVKGESADY